VVVAVLLVVVAPAGPTDHDQQHCYHHAPTVKPEAATAVIFTLGKTIDCVCERVAERNSKNMTITGG
jgi:hypothetical protein